MSVTPRGVLNHPVSLLAGMLSSCASFQKLVRTADAAHALPLIALHGERGQLARPYAVCGVTELRRRSIAFRNRMSSGNLFIDLEIPVVWSGTVSAVNELVLTVTDFAGLANDFFNGLSVRKNNAGTSVTVADFVGASGALTLAAALAVEVDDEVDVFSSSRADEMAFVLNLVGDIQEELEAQEGNASTLLLQDLAITNFGISEREEDGIRYGGARIEVAYGLG